jgi:hypothetical protein
MNKAAHTAYFSGGRIPAEKDTGGRAALRWAKHPRSSQNQLAGDEMVKNSGRKVSEHFHTALKRFSVRRVRSKGLSLLNISVVVSAVPL